MTCDHCGIEVTGARTGIGILPWEKVVWFWYCTTCARLYRDLAICRTFLPFTTQPPAEEER